MQSLGEKFCGVDRITLQSSVMFGRQRASSNHASVPCSGTTRTFDAGSTDSSPIPVDCEFCVFLSKLPAHPSEPLPAKPYIYLQSKDNIITTYLQSYTMFKFPKGSSSFVSRQSARRVLLPPASE